MADCLLKVRIDGDVREITVSYGANLRKTLLENAISPYAALLNKINCGGRGLCATCGVVVEDGEPAPQHWHDRIGVRFGYPRLSCQITVTEDMTVRILTDKWIWGRRNSKRRWQNDPTS